MSGSRYVIGGGRNLHSVRGAEAYSMTQLKSAITEYVEYAEKRKSEGLDCPPVHHVEVLVAYPELTEEMHLGELAYMVETWLREGELKDAFPELKTVGSDHTLAASSGGGFRAVDLSNILGRRGYTSALAIAAGNLRGITPRRPTGIPVELATQAFVELNLDQEVVPIMTWWGALFKSFLETTRPDYAHLLEQHAANTRVYADEYYSGDKRDLFDSHRLETLEDVANRERPAAMPQPLNPVETAPISNGRAWLWMTNERPNDPILVEIAGLGLGFAPVRLGDRDFSAGHEAEIEATLMAEEMAGKRLWDMDIVQTHSPFSAVPAGMLDYIAKGKYGGSKTAEDILRDHLVEVDGKDLVLDTLLGPVFGHIIDGTTLGLIAKMYQWLSGQREFDVQDKITQGEEMWGAVFGVGGLHSMDACAILRAIPQNSPVDSLDIPYVDRGQYDIRAETDLFRAGGELIEALPASADNMLVVAHAVTDDGSRQATFVTPAAGAENMRKLYPAAVGKDVTITKEMLGKVRVSLRIADLKTYLEIASIRDEN